MVIAAKTFGLMPPVDIPCYSWALFDHFSSSIFSSIPVRLFLVIFFLRVATDLKLRRVRNSDSCQAATEKPLQLETYFKLKSLLHFTLIFFFFLWDTRIKYLDWNKFLVSDANHYFAIDGSYPRDRSMTK